MLNWINNRRWFDNEMDRGATAEEHVFFKLRLACVLPVTPTELSDLKTILQRLYLSELREFKSFLVENTEVRVHASGPGAPSVRIAAA